MRAAAMLLVIAAAVAIGAGPADVGTWDDKKVQKQQDQILGGADRFVDVGIALHTVVQDLEHGTELLRGSPPLRIVATRRLGGMFDTRLGEFCGPSTNPVQWYVSEDQARLILHEDPLPDNLLVYGSEGGGKSVTLVMWAAVRAIEFAGYEPRREIGLTAPTGPRLKVLRKKIVQWWPAPWRRWVERESCFFTPLGVTVYLISTHQTSAKEGSRIQGYDWSAAGNDEMQDSTESDADIRSRLREAPGGKPKRIATATAKDHPEWRTWRDSQLKTKQWGRFDLLAERSPFIWKSFIEGNRVGMSEREFLRRYGARDVPPERIIYSAWDRTKNLRHRPTAEDATVRILDRWGGPFGILSGHDPGTHYRYTVLLQAWIDRNRRRKWWVVGEVCNKGGTVEQHVLRVLEELRTRWRCNVPNRRGELEPDALRALIRSDIYTDSGQDGRHPDRSVYTQFRKYQMHILPAAQKAAANGGLRPAQIPKNARIDMLNGLFCDVSGERSLFVDLDENEKPVAPLLVNAIESMERDLLGRAETEKKGDADQSHYPAALGYALWMLERPRSTDERRDVGQRDVERDEDQDFEEEL